MVDGEVGSGCQLRWRSSLSPWKRPQSNSTRCDPVSSRCLEPVTVPAAPRNVSEGIEAALLNELVSRHCRDQSQLTQLPGDPIQDRIVIDAVSTLFELLEPIPAQRTAVI